MRTGLVSALVGAVGCAPADQPANRDLDQMGAFVDSLRVEYEVPGAAFAAFDETGLLYEHVGGLKSTDTGELVDSNTVFEAASISKPVFAYVVLSLVDDGIVSLDEPLADLVQPVPELGYDPRAGLLTPRMLLTHQGGLPNWRSRLNLTAQQLSELFAEADTLRFTGQPGEAYRYSGEGYVLLQRVIEQATGRTLQELAQERVFTPLGMTRTSFRFDAKSRENYSQGHNEAGEASKWPLGATLASSTLHTTARDLARFGTHLAEQIHERGVDHPMASSAVSVGTNGDVAQSWGVGLGIVTVDSLTYVFHGGNNVIFIADFVYGVDENLGYVLLTNSSRGSALIQPLEQRIFGRSLQR